jgi:Mg-chelatase subunit ChlD
MNNSIITGSLGAIAKQSGKSIAETFMSCDVIILTDSSGSMSSEDSRGGQSRYNVACEELKNLQNSLPGKLAVLSFSDDVQFCPSGIPIFFGGGTDMAKALKFARVADIEGVQFIIITDGWPDSQEETLQVARTYKSRISTIFVGPETDLQAIEFLKKLSALSGGQHITADRAKELHAATAKLLSA